MSRLSTLKDRVQYRIKKSKESVFLVKDFADLSDRDQILRALRELMQDNVLLRVGKGVYTKTRPSVLFEGSYVPQDNLRAIAIKTMKKLGIKVIQTPAERAYNSRLTTQVPNTNIIGVNKRVSRNISFERASIRYETVNQANY
ncbi:MAG: DUF6088 family protein [Alphaproteobacteria bacterium]|nr:DUF6088 family protein [Alphaproteobacteria bacterium]